MHKYFSQSQKISLDISKSGTALNPEDNSSHVKIKAASETEAFYYDSDYTGAKFYYQMPFISSSELCSRI